MSAPLDRAVILAGGGGTRLWPWAGPRLPKPLLPLGGGGRTLLAATLERLQGLVPAGALAVQAAPELVRALAAGEPRLAGAALRDEPAARDTGPAVALAMRRALREEPGAVVAVLPADHRIDDVAAYRAAMARAAGLARGGRLVVLGVRPDGPDTRFGYVELGPPLGDGAHEVARFTEKPAPDLARRFVAGGRHLWNAGMFVWRADAFWTALERHAPELAAAVAEAEAGNAAAWERTPRTSIDYALMERAAGVAAVPLDAGWDDVGGWAAVLRLVARGDAGPARLVPARGEHGPGTVVLDVTGDVPQDAAVVVCERPILLVRGPHGLLVVPRDEPDRVKSFV
ncbi:MAG: NTP transferase domain-containing protein [Acidobacteria bacterium]|nr:NTP transferase domain-containing protein [Acidobacteriota bacterium]